MTRHCETNWMINTHLYYIFWIKIILIFLSKGRIPKTLLIKLCAIWHTLILMTNVTIFCYLDNLIVSEEIACQENCVFWHIYNGLPILIIFCSFKVDINIIENHLQTLYLCTQILRKKAIDECLKQYICIKREISVLRQEIFIYITEEKNWTVWNIRKLQRKWLNSYSILNLMSNRKKK